MGYTVMEKGTRVHTTIPDKSTTRALVSSSPARAGWERRAVGTSRLQRPIQAKLEVSPAHYALEREADVVADRVMRMPALPRMQPAGATGRTSAYSATRFTSSSGTTALRTPVNYRYSTRPTAKPIRHHSWHIEHPADSITRSR